jgi:hypothetical protein
MNTKFTKVLSVVLALVAVLAMATVRVFAANPAENQGISSGSGLSASFDDHGKGQSPSNTGEDFTISGVIEAINGNVYTINGKAVTINASSILDSGLKVGSTVKVEVITQADGSLLAKEIETKTEVETETETEHLNGDDHGTDTGKIDDHGTDIGKIDDHGTDTGKIDDHGTDTGKIDDHGTNTGKIDDHGTDTGKVDDHGGQSGKGGNSKP